jgi:signal transduction histidine kinase
MKLFSNISIRRKLIFIILIVSIFSVFIGFFLVVFNSISTFKEEMKNNTLINAKLISEYVAAYLAFDYMGEPAANETLKKIETLPSVVTGIVFNDKNQVFAQYYKNQNDKLVPAVPPNKESSEFRGHFLHVFLPIHNEGKIVGTIYLKVSNDALKEKIHTYTVIMFWIFIVVAIISYFLALGFQPIISRPIKRLTEATRRISQSGEYSVRVEKDGNDEIGILVDEYNKMLELIYSREESLKLRTIELSKTLRDLKRMQGKLIESEKLAALGHLIAGVAHEVNSPLGAIRSSVSNIANSLDTILNELPQFTQNLTPEMRELFFRMTSQALQNHKVITSKEERAFKRELITKLEEKSIANSETIADTLVDMGLYENVEPYLPIFEDGNCEEALKMAYKLTVLQRSTQNINFATDKASKVVFALKNFARIDQSGEMIKASIVDGVETVLTLYYNQLKHGVEVTREYDENLPHILCYPDELNQIWTNILHNALQAMQHKGKLHIQIYKKNNQIVVAITDDGPGIPDDIKSKIFQPFFTTKPAGEGTGLGLDIVNRIVEKHKGKIEVESIPGKTTFSIYLPIDIN